MKLNGYKSYLGSILKGFAGAAGSVILASLDKLPPATSAKAGAAAAGLWFLGVTLKEIGAAHKQEKETEAIKDQTQAIAEQTAVLQNAVIVTDALPGLPPPPAPVDPIRRRTGPDDNPA